MTRPTALRRPAQPSQPLDARVWHLAWVIAFGAFASGLDASLANIGLHTIATDLHSDLSATQWVTSAYLVALAVSLPICGWLSRRLGVGRLWLGALAAFTAASGLCAMAPDVAILVVFRIVQGLAAGLLIPAGQTILGQAVGPERLGQVMATLGIAVSLAPALGPVIGGLVLHAASWQWLFLINLPVGAAGLVLGARLIPRGRAEPSGKLDWPALGYVSVGLALLVYGLTEWAATGALISTSVLAPLVLGTAGVVAFVRRVRTQPHPLLDLRLYANPVYTAASLAAGFTGALMFGSALLFPLYFQLAHHDTVVGTGLRLLALGSGTAAALPLCGRLTDRYGGGIIAVTGTTATTVLTVLFALLPLTVAPAVTELALFALGAAIALAAVPTGIAAYKTVHPEQLPDATAQVNITQRLGGALGAALFAVLLARALPNGPTHAFHQAFWVQASVSLAALSTAGWLWLALRCNRQAEPASATLPRNVARVPDSPAPPRTLNPGHRHRSTPTTSKVV